MKCPECEEEVDTLVPCEETKQKVCQPCYEFFQYEALLRGEEWSMGFQDFDSKLSSENMDLFFKKD